MSNIQSFITEGLQKLRNDYNAAKPSRFRRSRPGVGVVPRHADWHYRMEIDWYRMMELHRDFDRNDCIVGQAIQRLIDNVLQDGITPDANTPDKELNKDLNARWDEEAENARIWDTQEEEGYHGLERDILHAVLVDGDVLGIGRDTGQLECVEAHRIRTPMRTRRNIVHGIEIDPNTRRRLKYYVTPEDVDPYSCRFLASDMEKVSPFDGDIRQAFHVYFRKRLSQTRGVSALAPVCDIAGMHDDLQFAALVKAQVASCFAVFREMSIGAPMPLTGKTGPQHEEQMSDGSARTIEGIAPGMQIQGRPGEKLQGFSPNVPNPEHFPHSILLLTFVSCNLNLPIALLLLDPRLAGNFSSFRGIWDQAKISLRKLQKRFVSRFSEPVRRFRLSHWMAEGTGEARRLIQAYEKFGPELFACKWRYPRWPYLEPVKDAQAVILRTRNLLVSPRRGAAECGDDWDDIVEESIEDNALAIEKSMERAAKIRTKYPDEKLDWREVLSLPTPDRVAVSMSGGETSDLSVQKELDESAAKAKQKSNSSGE